MKNGSAILLLVGLASFLALGDRYLISTLYEKLMGEYHISSTLVFSIIFTSFYIGYTAFQIPGGRLAERYGPSKVSGFSLIAWSLLFILMPEIRSFPLAVVVSFLIGVAQGPIFPSIIFILRLLYRDEQYARASGVTAAMGDLSPAIIPVAAFSLLFAGKSIVIPFLFFGLLGILVGLLLIIVRSRSTPHANSRKTVSINGRFILFGISFFIYDMFFYILFTWYPYFLKERFSISSASFLFGSMPWIIMAAGSVLFGLLMDKLNRDSLISIASYAIVLSSLIGISLVNNEKSFLVLTIISLLFLNPILLSSWRLSTRLSGEGRSSFVGGWMNFWGNVGGILAPFISAFMIERLGFSKTFLLSSAIPLAGMACWIYLGRSEE
ncbi:MAG: MFS transporter [Thermoplasmatales archaeon]